MLRFKPDSVLEGLLRPFIMVDPVAGVYLEDMAPDLRFAGLTLLLMAFFALRTWRTRRAAQAARTPPAAATTAQPNPHVQLPSQQSPLHAGQWRALITLWVMLLVWTFAIGNGRYFIGGLLLVGPALTMMCRYAPGTAAMRHTVLCLLVGLQGFVVLLTFTPNTWGLARWVNGEGLNLQASPLRDRPAVFLTLSSISYSIVVPQFHSQSRWANIAGQRDLLPGTPEYPRVQQLLASGLPIYAMRDINGEQGLANGQPNHNIRGVLNTGLAPHALRLAEADCVILRSTLAVTVADVQGQADPLRGFWFCPVEATARNLVPALPALSTWDPVFERLEARCPRFFPPGDSKLRQFSGISVRYYTLSDTRVYIDGEGNVMYRYFRAMNPTYLGTADQVLRGEFALNCDKLPGRYVPPWRRD